MFKKLKEGFSFILPGFCILPLIFTVILNFSVYIGCRLIRIRFDLPQHNIGTWVDELVPIWYPAVIVYVGCYIFWIINYIYNARMSKEHCYHFLGADWFGKVVCFFFYILYPTTNTRPDIIGEGACASLLRLVYNVDAADNLFPSIHCLVSWICYIGIRGNKNVPRWFRVGSLIWALAIFYSTIATRQHVIVDVIAGVALAELGYWLAGHIIKRHRRIQNIQ